MHRITQMDIAKKTGFSQTLVSIVLNDQDNITISPATKQLILEGARELGFTPRFTRTDRRNRTGNIGYMLPGNDVSYFIGDSYYHQFFEGISKNIMEKEYNLTSLSVLQKNELLKNVQNKKFDGLIIEAAVDKEWAEKIKEIVPVVFLNHNLEGSKIDSVMPDNRGGVKKAVSCLYKQGHRRIALFGMTPLNSHIHHYERLCGYKEAIAEFEISEGQEEYIKLPERKHGGQEEVSRFAYESLKKWLRLKKPPSAVVALNDVYALSLLQAAMKLGVNIPRQLSVIGFDNINACLYSYPTLTSLNQHMEEMGYLSSQILFERIQTPDITARKTIVDVDLIERDSTVNI